MKGSGRDMTIRSANVIRIIHIGRDRSLTFVVKSLLRKKMIEIRWR
jgi:hypothetical protein